MKLTVRGSLFVGSTACLNPSCPARFHRSEHARRRCSPASAADGPTAAGRYTNVPGSLTAGSGWEDTRTVVAGLRAEYAAITRLEADKAHPSWKRRLQILGEIGEHIHNETADRTGERPVRDVEADRNAESERDRAIAAVEGAAKPDVNNEGDGRWAKFLGAQQRLDEANKEVNRVIRARQRAEARWADKYVESLVGVLSEVRPMGGTLTVHEKGNRQAAEAVQAATRMYPSSWVELSNAATAGRPLVSQIQKKGGVYRKSVDARFSKGGEPVPVSVISTSRKRGNPEHELAHRMEHVVEGLGQAEQAYHRVRTTDTVGVQFPSSSHQGDETIRVFPDAGFSDPYASRDYEGDGSSWEVVSVGVGNLCGDNESRMLGLHGRRDDPSHRSFVFGALATI